MKNRIKVSGVQEKEIVWELKDEGGCLKLYANDDLIIISIWDDGEVLFHALTLRELGFKII